MLREMDGRLDDNKPEAVKAQRRKWTMAERQDCAGFVESRPRRRRYGGACVRCEPEVRSTSGATSTRQRMQAGKAFGFASGASGGGRRG